MTAEKRYQFKSHDEARNFFGRHDEHLRLIEKEYNVQLFSQGEELVVSGQKKDVASAAKLIDELLIIIRSGGLLRKEEVQYAIRTAKQNRAEELPGIYLDRIEIPSKRQFITPKTPGQKEYVDAI